MLRRSPTTQFLTQIAWVGLLPKWVKYNLFLTFFLSRPFFLVPTPSSNRATDIHALWLKMMWFRPRTVLFGVRTMSDILGGNVPKRPQKGAWRGVFKPNWQNLKIAISPKPYIRSVQNLMTKITPSTARRGWSVRAVNEIQYSWSPPSWK